MLFLLPTIIHIEPVLLLFVANTFAQNNCILETKRAETIITVGEKGSDIFGFTNKDIQAAIYALPVSGGTVKLSSGTFEIIAPVKVTSNVNLIGSGSNTILKISEGVTTFYIDDADYGELFVTVKDPTGFRIGMAVQISDNHFKSCWDVSTAKVTDIKENVIYFDKHLIQDYEVSKEGVISNSTSGIEVVEASNVTISNLTIEGNREKSAPMDGCRGGGIYAFKAKNVIIENIEVKNFNGEGISWQITENVTVKNCKLHHNRVNGVHPGTGSPKTLVENNIIYNNDNCGIFLCWRVRHSIFRNNEIYNNIFGISTGHKDTDVLFEKNHIYDNKKSGVTLRNENNNNAPHNNSFVGNIIENNGTKDKGYGFLLLSAAKNLLLKENIIRDTKNGTQKAAIFYGENSLPVEMSGNTISGHPEGVFIKEKLK